MIKDKTFLNNTSIITFLTGRLISNYNGDIFRIIQINNNGSVILKNKLNKLIYSNMSIINDCRLNLA